MAICLSSCEVERNTALVSVNPNCTLGGENAPTQTFDYKRESKNERELKHP